MFQNEQARTGFNNNAGQQNFANQQSARNAWMQEQFALRNQPINEIGALLGTGQVQQPNFANVPTAQMPTTDVAGLVNNNYNQQLQGWQQQQANRQSLTGGLFGLGAAGITALNPFGMAANAGWMR
jgi:hypothetical protein